MFSIYGIGADESIAAEKYRYWWEHQRALMANPFEIRYESLAGHEQWVAPDQRRNFGRKQWKP